MKHDLTEILNSCIEDMLAGRMRLEACLRNHADVRDELEPLLIAALRMHEYGSSIPSSTRQQQSRERMLAVAEKKRWEAGVERTPAARAAAATGRPRFALRLSALTMVLLMCCSVALAATSQNSLPGNALYPVKRAIEQARLALTGNEAAQRELLLAAASTRLDELDRLPEDSRFYEQIAIEAEESIEKAEALDIAREAGSNDTSMQSIRGKNLQALERALEKAPPAARPALKQVLARAENRSSFRNEKNANAKRDKKHNNGKTDDTVKDSVLDANTGNSYETLPYTDVDKANGLHKGLNEDKGSSKRGNEGLSGTHKASTTTTIKKAPAKTPYYTKRKSKQQVNKKKPNKRRVIVKQTTTTRPTATTTTLSSTDTARKKSIQQKHTDITNLTGFANTE